MSHQQWPHYGHQCCHVTAAITTTTDDVDNMDGAADTDDVGDVDDVGTMNKRDDR